MYSRGHWGVAMLLFSPILALLMLTTWFSSFPVEALALLSISILGFTSYIPDIDMKLKNTLPIKHRGITHTVWFALFLGCLSLAGSTITLYYLSVVENVSVLSFTEQAIVVGYITGITIFGVLTHFVGDIITPMGLRPYQPVSDKRYVYEMTLKVPYILPTIKKTVPFIFTLKYYEARSLAKSKIWNGLFFYSSFIALGLAVCLHRDIFPIIISLV